MSPPRTHGAFVDAWIEQAAPGLAARPLVQVFGRAFDALWDRARSTLSEVTLEAVARRVVADASDTHAFLDGIRVKPAGFSFRTLEKRAGTMEVEELREALRSLLVHFLTLLGTLTGEVLTPTLHDQLLAVRSRHLWRGGSQNRRTTDGDSCIDG